MTEKKIGGVDLRAPPEQSISLAVPDELEWPKVTPTEKALAQDWIAMDAEIRRLRAACETALHFMESTHKAKTASATTAELRAALTR